jgi:hypothetical protein
MRNRSLAFQGFKKSFSAHGVLLAQTMDAPSDFSMFRPIEPRRTGMLPADDIHILHWEEESGNLPAFQSCMCVTAPESLD